MNDTNIMFLGTTACIFDKNDDTPSFLINKKYLFDTGFALVNNLVNNDIDPLSIKYLFFTHMHHDHYISLPSFLFDISTPIVRAYSGFFASLSVSLIANIFCLGLICNTPLCFP